MIVRTTLALLLCLAAGALAADAQPRATARTVVVTIDDLPVVGAPESLGAADRVARSMLAALAAHEAPASAFVTGSRVWVDGEIDERLDLLRRWRDAGVRLENHGFGHLSFNETPVPQYLDDLAQGHLVAERLMRERGDSVRFFRAPYNQTGPTEADRAALLEHLHARDLRLAPFTVEHGDYLFDAAYRAALARGDDAAARRIGAAYLAHLDTAFTYAETLSRDTFGREIPQVFLIHANRINADYLAPMLSRLAARGYRYASLDEALQDAAYATTDGYAGRWGISWLHRWRRGLGLENRLRYEPDPPDWVLEAASR